MKSGPKAKASPASNAPILLYGRRPVQTYVEMLIAGEAGHADDVAAVWLSESFPAKFKQQILRALPLAPLYELPRRQLDQEFPGVHHQGAVLVFHPGAGPGAADEHADWRDFVREKSGLLVLLDRVQDPHNLGSIIRSAEALGARAVFITGQGAPLNDTAHRVSSGASLRLPVFTQSNLHQLVEYLKSCGYWICAAADADALSAPGGPSGKESRTTSFTHHELARLPAAASEVALIIGSEGEGIKPLVLHSSDYVITIALSGKTESLNAGVAAGILIDRLLHR